jgi:hypothetical protein
MNTPIAPAVRGNRVNQRNILGRFLSGFFGSPLPNAATHGVECLPEIEQKIQTVITQLRFESAETRGGFIQRLRMTCMIYKLLPEVYRRKPPLSSNPQFRLAKRMRRLRGEFGDKNIEDALGQWVDRVSSGEKLKSEHVSWGST